MKRQTQFLSVLLTAMVFTVSCKSSSKIQSDAKGLTGVGDLSRLEPAVRKALNGYLQHSHNELMGKDTTFAIRDMSFSWSVNPFAYAVQVVGIGTGVKFGVSSFKFEWKGKLYPGGSVDFQYSPVGGAFGSKPCFDFELYKVVIPITGAKIEDNLWQGTLGGMSKDDINASYLLNYCIE